MLLLSRRKQECDASYYFNLRKPAKQEFICMGRGGWLLEQKGNYYPDSDIYLYFFFKARPFDTKWWKGPDTE